MKQIKSNGHLTLAVGKAISLVISIVLAAAALLKLRSTVLHPGARYAWYPPELLDIVAFIELGIAACWLFTGFQVFRKWWLTLWISLAFVLSGIWSMAHGVVRCGCFGEHDLGGILELGITGFLLLNVCVVRPSLSVMEKSDSESKRSDAKLGSFTLVLLLFASFLWMVLFHSAIGRSLLPVKRTMLTLALDRSTSLSANGVVVVELGKVAAGMHNGFELRVDNRGQFPGWIIGAFRSCTCIGLSNHLGIVGAGESRTVNVLFVAPEQQGEHEYDASLYTRGAMPFELPFRIRCNVQ